MWMKEVPVKKSRGGTVEEVDEKFTKVPLDRFRPFQSFVALTDQIKNDSTLLVIPGFFGYAEEYYEATGRHGRSMGLSSYVTKMTKEEDKELLDKAYPQVVHRIPDDWECPDEGFPWDDAELLLLHAKNSGYVDFEFSCLSIDDLRRTVARVICEHAVHKNQPNGIMAAIANIEGHKRWPVKRSIERMCSAVGAISDEHARMKLAGNEIRSGDFVIWDIRTPHQNGWSNDTTNPRKVFYHAYLAALPEVNGNLIDHVSACREKGEHISDFPQQFRDIEKLGGSYKPPPLTELGTHLYNKVPWSNMTAEMLFRDDKMRAKATPRHIAYLKRYGYVVIENLVSQELVDNLATEIDDKLASHGVNIKDLTGPMSGETWKNFTKISGTFGGMLEFFWLPGQEIIRQDKCLYNVAAEIVSKTWCSGDVLYKHGYGDELKPEFMWLYSDRCNYRFPKHWNTTESVVLSPKRTKSRDSGAIAKKKQSKLFTTAMKEAKTFVKNLNVQSRK